MAPSKDRYKDVVLNPCNRTVERRNTAAIRDALEGLADELDNLETGETSDGGGDTLIFFVVAADNIGGDSVAVTELVYNSGTGNWDATGSSYTAYDWSGSDRWKNNFATGYYGLGRLNTDIAADALEVISLEGKARLIQVTLDENMGATTTKQAASTVTQFWGADPNGANPGGTVTIHDVTNMAPEAKTNDVALAVWDEKRQFYVMIAPWKGTQTPGTTTIVRCDGGDSLKGCDSSSTEGSFCVHSGKLQVLSVAGDFCTEKFTDGATCWILDGRNCHGNSRLGNNERYVAVSAGVTFDPDPGGGGSDERALYVVVDYAPAIRWFRILSDAESLASQDEVNDLECRQHDCGGPQDDDAPSMWGVWEDIDPCTRVLGVLDATEVLVYFPMYRYLCKDAVDQTYKEQCIGGGTDPDCRKNKHIPAYWNPIAERWDALEDAGDCASEQDVSLIYVCTSEPDPDCCVYDALRIKFWPQDNSYCAPVREYDQVWMKCNTQSDTIDKGFCELGVRICDAFECNGETRPVYLVKCTSCPGCLCPEEDDVAQVRVVTDEAGACGYVNDVTGKLYCFPRNPFVAASPLANGFAGIITFQGLAPRVLFLAPIKPGNDPPYTDDLVYLEIAGFGHPTEPPGDIINAFAFDGVNFNVVAKPAPSLYDGGIFDCEPLIEGGQRKWRVNNYAYGVWFECGDTGSPPSAAPTNGQLFWLDPDYAQGAISKCGSGTRVFLNAPATDVLAGPEDLSIESLDCCANRILACPGDLTMSCIGSNPDTDLTVEGTGDSLPLCNLEGGTHYFGGCPCAIVSATAGATCNQNVTSCSSSEICFELSWPFN